MADLVTPAEAAAWLGVDEKTVSRRADRGLIRYSRTVGGHRRYDARDVAAMAGTARPTPSPPPPPVRPPASSTEPPAPPPQPNRSHLDALTPADAGVVGCWLVVVAHDRDLTRRGARIVSAIADELLARSRQCGQP